MTAGDAEVDSDVESGEVTWRAVFGGAEVSIVTDNRDGYWRARWRLAAGSGILTSELRVFVGPRPAAAWIRHLADVWGAQDLGCAARLVLESFTPELQPAHNERAIP